VLSLVWIPLLVYNSIWKSEKMTTAATTSLSLLQRVFLKDSRPLLVVSSAIALVSLFWAVAVETYLVKLEGPEDDDGPTLDPRQVALLTAFAVILILYLLRPQLVGLVPLSSSSSNAAAAGPAVAATAVVPPSTPSLIKPGLILTTPGSNVNPSSSSPYKWTPSFGANGSSASKPVVTNSAAVLAVNAPPSASAVVAAKQATPGPKTPMTTTAVSIATPLSGSTRKPGLVDESVYLSPSTPLVLKRATKTTETSALATPPPIAPATLGTMSEQRLVLAAPGTTTVQTTPGAFQQQLAVVGTPTPAAVVGTAIEPAVSDEEAANAIIQRIGVGEQQSGAVLMEAWVSNLKQAMRTYIERQVLEPLDRVHRALASIRRSPHEEPMFSIASLEWDEDPRRQQEDLQLRFNFVQNVPEYAALLRTRKDLERFLTVQRRANMVPFPKKYVLARLRSLVESDSLAGYDWCGGEDIRGGGERWTADVFPTDAEILFRVFCVWMETLVKRDEMDSFSKEYVRDAGGAEGGASVDELREKQWTGFLNYGRVSSATRPTLSTPMLFASPGTGVSSGDFSSSPQYWPHYKLMVKGVVWEVKARRLNLFHAIVLFLYVLKVNNIGRIQEIIQDVFRKSA